MARQLDAAEQQYQYRSINFGTPDLQFAKLSIHALYSEGPIDLRGQVVRKARIAKDHAVADIGCGTGAFLRYLRDSGHRGPIYGIDLADGVFRDGAGQQPSIGWAVADAAAVPIGSGAVDVACLQHMLGYVPDIAAACREARRVTRVGGTVVATTRSAADYPHALAYRERARDLFGWPPIEVNTTRFCLENMVGILETDDVEAEVQRLEALGATRWDHQQLRGFDFWVMRDPWGNEFCVLQTEFPALLAGRRPWP